MATSGPTCCQSIRRCTGRTHPEAWAVATGRRAPALGQSGRVAVGDPADFLLVRSDAPELTPGDLTANLVYGF